MLHIIDTLKVAYEIAKKNRTLKLDKAEKAFIAKVFNDRYCYRKLYNENAAILPGTAYGAALPRGGNRWMCPECNKIHEPTECSVWDGLHYPACCSYTDGNRLYDNIRIS